MLFPDEGDEVEVVAESTGEVIARGRVSDINSVNGTVGQNEDSELHIERFTVNGNSRTVQVSVSGRNYDDDFLEGDTENVEVKVLDGDDIRSFETFSWRVV